MFKQKWYPVTKRDPRAVFLYSRHYSSRVNNKEIKDWLSYGIASPGESMVLLTSAADALFVWLQQKYHLGDQSGVYCAVFRNEGEYLSSELILEAEELAMAKWPGEQRLFTYVNPEEIESSNPGYCFKQAGWQLVRNDNGKPKKTSRGLIVLEKVRE